MKIYAELHCHTRVIDKYGNLISDGSKPEKMIAAAIQKNLDCLAITDHNTMVGYKNCKKIIKKYKIKNLFLIPSIEIKSKGGDILAHGLKKYVKGGKSVEETIENILKNDGLPVIAHPTNFPNTSVTIQDILRLSPKIEKILDRYDKKLGIEVWNGMSFDDYLNGYACGLAYKLIKVLKKQEYYFIAGGSDAHFPNKVGFVKTQLNVKEMNLDSILEAIQKPVKIIVSKESFTEMVASIVRNYFFSRQGISSLFFLRHDINFKKGIFGLFF